MLHGDPLQWTGPPLEYAVPAHRAWMPLLIVGFALAGVTIGVLAGDPETGRPGGTGTDVIPFVAVCIVLVAVGLSMFLAMRRGARVTLSSEGVTSGRDSGMPVTVRWDEVAGARRRWTMLGVVLTDASGTARATISDQLEGVEDCLARVADFAAFPRAPLPVRHPVRGGIPLLVAMGFALAGIVGALAFARDVPPVPFVVLLLVFAAVGFVVTTQVALEVAVDDEGVRIRRPLRTAAYRWNEIGDCGFAVRNVRGHRNVRMVLRTSRGVAGVLAGASDTLPLVALVRAELRRRGGGTVSTRP